MGKSGLNLQLVLHFDHDAYGSINKLTYKVEQLPLEARTNLYIGEQEGSEGHTEELVTQQRRGIRIHLKITGNAGEMSFHRFMIAVVASFALLGVVDLIVTVLLLYVLPLRAVYRAYVLEETVDFSCFTDGEVRAVEGVNEVMAKNGIISGAGEITSYAAAEKGRRSWNYATARRSVSTEKLRTGLGSMITSQAIPNGFNSVSTTLNGMLNGLSGRNGTPLGREQDLRRSAAVSTDLEAGREDVNSSHVVQRDINSVPAAWTSESATSKATSADAEALPEVAGTMSWRAHPPGAMDNEIN